MQLTPAPDDAFGRRLRGFGPVGVAAMVVIYFGNAIFIPLTAILVLLWAWRSRTPWREIGFVRPENWTRVLFIAAAFGCAFKLVMKALVMPLLGAPPTNQAFQFLVGNSAALPGILYLILAGAAFGEEIFFRGFLFERLGKLFGSTPWAKTAIVLITTTWFALEHYSLQGLPGVQQAAIVGLVFGAIFAVTGRLWPLVIAHAAFDLTAVAIIYWDLETEIAHLIFH